jgi:transketolase
MAGDLPADYAARLPEVLATIAARGDTVATRKASQNALDLLAPLVPELLSAAAPT